MRTDGYVLKSGLRGSGGKAADRFTVPAVELAVFVLLYLLSSQPWQFLQVLFNKIPYCSSKRAAAERFMRDDSSWLRIIFLLKINVSLLPGST